MTGLELRAWRQENNITQEELALWLDVLKSTVYRWEHEERTPPAGRILDLALEAINLRRVRGLSADQPLEPGASEFVPEGGC